MDFHTGPAHPIDIDAEPDSAELAQSALHAIVNGRKSWKTIRGKSEAVWPPYLEGALIEGLQKYRQTEGLRVSALGGGRFPMRNRFISEHIFNTTGKRRTPKQVGSRLQQLRDTRGGKQVLKLLSDRSPPNSAARPSPSSERTPEFETSIVNIPILRPSSPHASPSPMSSPASHAQGAARPIRQIDNTLTFASHCPLPSPEEDAQSPFGYVSEFVVRGAQGEVHRETTQLHLVKKLPAGEEADGKEKYLYSTTLVPAFWERLCASSDPTQYTITQQIVKSEKKPVTGASSPTSSSDLRLPSRSPSPSSSSSSTEGESDKLVVLAMCYRFVYQSASVGQDASGLWTAPGDDRRPSTSSSASSYISDEPGVEQSFAFHFGMDVDPAPAGYDSAALDRILSSSTSLPPLMLDAAKAASSDTLANWSAPVTPVDVFTNMDAGAGVGVFGQNQVAMNFGGWEGAGGYPYAFGESAVQMSGFVAQERKDGEGFGFPPLGEAYSGLLGPGCR
ncbi:hypothetical protein OE88DRAFT_1735550 [Heliocybe sulcata]|uniref:TEA domain-containing protein n=1 Tax=Heliocybe sulcata TaxID=5364 RepID=A0A5C3N2Z4_9AGAM|nr:hypothetical protein OE88DRAFT_1735550 [Heliocybe sulcata]